MDQARIKKLFQEAQLDALVSFAAQTRIWFAKVQTTEGALIIERDRADLWVDARYIEYATKNAQNVDLHLLKPQALETYFQSKNYLRVGFEKEYITFEQLSKLKTMFSQQNVEFIPISTTALRIVKSKDEIKLIRQAGKIALQALEDIKPLIQPGITEVELDAELERALRLRGASKGSFEAIVVSGTRGAMPHGKPSTKKIHDGELVTIDFGALYQGYCSDITRTFVVGQLANEKLKTISKVLREAQKLGIAAVKPGVSTWEIDRICREYINQHGFGQYFVHSTGHGLGIDVHELPYVSPNQKSATILEPGMVITVEPGIYIEDLGGIRVEDDILVTKHGSEVLSKLD